MEERPKKKKGERPPLPPARPGRKYVDLAPMQFSIQPEKVPRESTYPSIEVSKGLAKALTGNAYKPPPPLSSQPGYKPPTRVQFTDAELKQAFQAFDMGQENRVGVEELRHLFCTMGDEFTDEELDNMVKLLDFHQNDAVQYEEFYLLFRNPEVVFRSTYITNLNKEKAEAKRLAALSKEQEEEEERVRQEAEANLAKGAQDVFREMFGGQAAGDIEGEEKKDVTLTPADVKLYYRRFKAADVDNSGFLDYLEFCQMMDKKPGGDMQRLFQLFDRDGSGTIEVKEFVLGISMFSNAPPIEKLKLCFSMYDADSSQLIEENELRALVENNFAFAEGRDLEDKEVDQRCGMVYEYLRVPYGQEINYEQFMEIARLKPQLLLPIDQLTADTINKLTE